MRGFILALAGLLCVAAAQAQTPLPDERPGQLLGCLTSRERPPRLPDAARDPTRPGFGLVRLRLVFARADAPPQTQVLANTGTEAMQDEVLDYVKTLRLPCLPAGDKPVAAVQEFRFDRTKPSPMEMTRPLPEWSFAGRPCVVMPRKDGEGLMPLTENMVVKTLFRMRFDGDGEQPPQVDVLYTNAGTRVLNQMRERMAEYRMPCRKAGDPAVAYEQMAIVQLRGVNPSVFREQRVSLDKFLRWIQGSKELKASFDFDTMDCPFRATWVLRRPHLPNQAFVRDAAIDPNRAEFLNWLAGLEMKLDERASERLFGESMDIDIPCGQLSLQPAER